MLIGNPPLRPRVPSPTRAVLAAEGRRLLCHPAFLAALVTAAVAVVWAMFLTGLGTDLSAQQARADFARAYPGSADFLSWYGGVCPAAYSMLGPYVFAAVGTRTASALGAVAGATLITWLFVRYRAPRPRAAALWTAAALGTGLLAGQATFTVGAATALGALVVTAADHPGPAVRRIAAALLAVLGVMLSPVTGPFLLVTAAALALTGRRADGTVLAGAAVLPLAVMFALFGDGGVQPISVLNGGPAIAAVLLVLVLVPREWRAVRIGAMVYAAGVTIAWIVPTAMGSNVERLGLLLGGPVLVGMTRQGDRSRRLLMIGTTCIGIWQIMAPARDFVNRTSLPNSNLATAALADELTVLGADTARVEAVPEYGHWESEQLAATVPLARGWERQTDIVRNPIFYNSQLTPTVYYAWLRQNSVRYIAISTGKADYAARIEAQIVRARQPWLAPIWSDGRWTLYQVLGSEPLAERPAQVISTTPAEIQVWMPRAGTTTVRVHWSRFLHSDGGGDVAPDGDWTRLVVPHRGRYVISAVY